MKTFIFILIISISIAVFVEQILPIKEIHIYGDNYIHLYSWLAFFIIFFSFYGYLFLKDSDKKFNNNLQTKLPSIMKVNYWYDNWVYTWNYFNSNLSFDLCSRI